MPKFIKPNEFAAILKIVGLSPEGFSIHEIQSKLTPSLPIHSLQRRLGYLIKEGKIYTVGKARAQRYFLVEEAQENHSLHFLPLSAESKNILTQIELPPQKRKPVGYNREFLDIYRPNVTYYLPENVRQKLQEQGKTDGQRPAGTYARQIYNRLLIDLSWNSSRLEGNTYSLLETERLLELSEVAEGKDLQETQMILNHKAAIEFLVEDLKEFKIDTATVLNVHALLSNNLLADPAAGGRVRSKSIGIAKSVYNPLVVPNMIQECFQQIIDTAKAIRDPIEQSFFLMVHIPYLQPFEDVNKRVSRLIANIPLIRENLSPLSFVDVPVKMYISGLLAIYELNRIDLLRDVFIWAYERSCALYSAARQSLGQPDPFRMKYRQLIFDTVSSTIKGRLNKKNAVSHISQIANLRIPKEDQVRFVEVLEIELRGLHEGNIARYRLLPSEFEEWHNQWS